MNDKTTMHKAKTLWGRMGGENMMFIGMMSLFWLKVVMVIK
jgi:hypothetical protein